jgi:hypothetical protein
MTDYVRKAGSTSVSVVVFIFDPATGLPDTTVIHSTSGLDLEYRREGAASVDITEVTLASLTTAWTSGGFLHMGNGHYRLDVPNLAVDVGVTGVQIHGALTSRAIVGCYIHLVSYDPFDTVRLGLTSLPNVASGSAGAIPTTGTGSNQISVTSGGVILSTAGLGSVADAVLDEPFTGHVTTGTPAAVLKALPEATAGSVGGLALYDNVFSIAVLGSVDDATSPTGANFSGNAGLEATSNTKYVGAFLVFPQGATLHPEARKISAYTASTRTFAFNGTGTAADRPFSAAPTNGDPFFIIGIHGT